MACPSIATGDQFLLQTLAHIDCQAQVIGSYGYLALGQPGSVASLLVTGLLTLFIALFGIRLLFGPPPGARDVVFDVIKIGIVLTLAFSWPAFRMVIYDVTLKGPAELASVVQTSSQPAVSAGMPQRLQEVDRQIVELTALGTGRNTGQFVNREDPASTFAGSALQDDAALGYARLAYLAGTIGALGLLRIAAGLLLAIAPVVAGLLLFTQSRGLFAGWLRGLVLGFLGSLGTTAVLMVELAVIEPWLASAINLRTAGYAAPSAPIELFAITLAFALVNLAMIWFLARIAFYRGWPAMPDLFIANRRDREEDVRPVQTAAERPVEILRSERVSQSIESSIRRERQITNERILRQTGSSAQNSAGASEFQIAGEPPRLGSSYRRPMSRPSRSATLRDSAR